MTRKRLIQNPTQRYTVAALLAVLTGVLLFLSRQAFPPQKS